VPPMFELCEELFRSAGAESARLNEKHRRNRLKAMHMARAILSVTDMLENLEMTSLSCDAMALESAAI